MKGEIYIHITFSILKIFAIIKGDNYIKKCDLIYFKNVTLLPYKPFNNYVSPLILPNQIMSPLYIVLSFFDIFTFDIN